MTTANTEAVWSELERGRARDAFRQWKRDIATARASGRRVPAETRLRKAKRVARDAARTLGARAAPRDVAQLARRMVRELEDEWRRGEWSGVAFKRAVRPTDDTPKARAKLGESERQFLTAESAFLRARSPADKRAALRQMERAVRAMHRYATDAGSTTSPAINERLDRHRAALRLELHQDKQRRTRERALALALARFDSAADKFDRTPTPANQNKMASALSDAIRNGQCKHRDVHAREVRLARASEYLACATGKGPTRKRQQAPTFRAKLTPADIKALPSSAFGLVRSRAYPIPTPTHAKREKERACKDYDRGVITSRQLSTVNRRADAIIGRARR